MEHTSKKKLLIVDDSVLIIDRLKDALTGHNRISEILTAVNFSEAVEKLEKANPDVVILDIQMTGKNGIDLLKLIVKESPEIEVIMLSNLYSDYYLKLCKEIGATFFLDKSKDFDLIPGILSSLKN